MVLKNEHMGGGGADATMMNLAHIITNHFKYPNKNDIIRLNCSMQTVLAFGRRR